MPHAHSTAKLLVIPSTVALQFSPPEFEDALNYFAPDALTVLGPQEHSYTTAAFDHITDDSVPVVFESFGASLTDDFRPVKLNDIDVVFANTAADIGSLSDAEADGLLNTDTETYIVSGLLSLNIDTDSLSTTLTGLSEYHTALSPTKKKGSYTHLTTKIEAGYAHRWEGLRIRGIGLQEGPGLPPLTCFTLDREGHTKAESLDPGKLGLRAIHGVGPTTEDRLQAVGITTTEDIAATTVRDLAKIKGIGSKTGEKLRSNAQAFTEGRIIRTSDTPLPGQDPVFIDIETDGLNPTIAWLIGVQDGINGNYISFIQPDPEEPGKAVRDFMLWYTTNASDRTLIAWNGWNFDFPVLREQITAHCPQYLEAWKRASKRDPLRWARDLDNAVFPGRTNKLEHVADALGWEHDDTGLSGAAVGRAYRRWIETRSPDHELNWERHKSYCEDDVRSLAFIYEKMDEANRLAATNEKRSQPIRETTDQGTLGDAY
ncbi:ribonuclease H-like domain-containing protein [Halococcus sediminicola]|uniref:ribonuclease H-like domain-containing protein n=1 Tax=Halococcus sediminicola TaxID=1264579 RepID=UPI0006798D65|nr:ribonuclease H-like domain-containing protein [Halococcus sediminicola]